MAADAPTLAQVRSRIKWLGITDFEYSNEHSSITLQAYTPKGKQWKATGCHTLIVSAFSNPKLARREFMADLSLGIQPCENTDCEYCNPIAED